ncbi:hypothetical protein SNE40_002976 [Patella caerulea]|uniref:Uncharacterized protein n=1 Tax=Patella caerulea TaxID=87958 RepID=A0AAN8Q4B8_PATCE
MCETVCIKKMFEPAHCELTDQFGASRVLAAALNQMDGIISSTDFEFRTDASDHADHAMAFRKARPLGRAKVCYLLYDLKRAVEGSRDRKLLLDSIPADVVLFLRDWLLSEEVCLEVSPLHPYTSTSNPFEHFHPQLPIQINVYIYNSVFMHPHFSVSIHVQCIKPSVLMNMIEAQF